MSFKAGYVGLIGMPNAGKSTLANALVGEKIAIVTHKAQTTRNRILGIVSQDNFQIVLADAPGVVKAKRGLNSFLQDEYKDVMDNSDVLVAVLNIDCKKEDEIEEIIQLVKSANKPWIACVTKEDLNKIHRVEKIRYKIQEAGADLVIVSALKKAQKCRELFFEKVVSLLPDSPAPLYDPELFTTSTIRDMVSEIVREKCFEQFHEEIPYGMAVQVREYEEGDLLDKIHVDILVEKEAHKRIVIGKKGSALSRISQPSRKAVEDMLGKKVFMEIYVKVKEDWTGNRSVMRELGYVVDK